VPNFVKISHSVAEILWFFVFFSRLQTCAILDMFGVYLDHSKDYSMVSITVQNLVMIDVVVMIIWTLQYLAHMAGKRLFTPQKLGLWSYLTPYMGCNINKSQKGTPLHESASFEPSNVKIWRAIWPVDEFLKRVLKLVIFHSFAQKPPMERFLPNFAQL